MTSPQSITPEIQEYIDRAVSRIPLNNSWSFLQGFFFGQLSIVILVIVFIKYMLFEENNNNNNNNNKKSPLSISSLLTTTTNHNNNTTIPANTSTTASLPTLIKFYKNLYDPIYNNRSESSDWLNVLLAQIICQYRDDAKTDNSLIRFVDEILNGGEKPSFLGSIKVTRLDLGEDFPVFSNVRIKPIDNSGRMRIEINCNYDDNITLGIDTQILINWPKPKIAVLPISLALSVIKFEATVTLEIVKATITTTEPSLPPSSPPPSPSTSLSSLPLPPLSLSLSSSSTPSNTSGIIGIDSNSNDTTTITNTTNTSSPSPSYITISVLPDFMLEFGVQSLIGARSKLEDVPKITHIITSKLRNAFCEKLVYPNFEKIKIPELWSFDNNDNNNNNYFD